MFHMVRVHLMYNSPYKKNKKLIKKNKKNLIQETNIDYRRVQ